MTVFVGLLRFELKRGLLDGTLNAALIQRGSRQPGNRNLARAGRRAAICEPRRRDARGWNRRCADIYWACHVVGSNEVHLRCRGGYARYAGKARVACSI